MNAVRGQLEADDYLAALLLARQYNKVFRALRAGVWTVIAVLGLFYGIATVGDPRNAPRLVVILLAGAVLILERHVFLPLRARRIFRQQRSMQLPFELRYSDEGIEWESVVTTRRLRWDYYVRWAEGTQHFLLYQSDWMFEIVPKRFFSDREAVDAFRNLLVTHLDQA